MKIHEPPKQTEPRVRETVESVTRSAPVPETTPANFWQDASK